MGNNLAKSIKKRRVPDHEITNTNSSIVGKSTSNEGTSVIKDDLSDTVESTDNVNTTNELCWSPIGIQNSVGITTRGSIRNRTNRFRRSGRNYIYSRENIDVLIRNEVENMEIALPRQISTNSIPRRRMTATLPPTPTTPHNSPEFNTTEVDVLSDRSPEVINQDSMETESSFPTERNNNEPSTGRVRILRKQKFREREYMKYKHTKLLISKYFESVDGGYLAPYHYYDFKRVNYDCKEVHKLILQRKLAPFYAPLIEYNINWTDEELLKKVIDLPLHEHFKEYTDDYENVPNGKLSNDETLRLTNPTLSRRDRRRVRDELSDLKLKRKRILWQEQENERYVRIKKISLTRSIFKNKHISNKELLLAIYHSCFECPICFLYIPEPFNYSNCCSQPICSECFVKIKRSDPHFPHGQDLSNNRNPDLLISVSVSCPFCKRPDFGVTYNGPTNRKTGKCGIFPGFYKKENQTIRNSSSLQNTDNVVHSDDIRPHWRAQLTVDRISFARRSIATGDYINNQAPDGRNEGRVEVSNILHSNVAVIDLSNSNSENVIDNNWENSLINNVQRLSVHDT